MAHQRLDFSPDELSRAFSEKTPLRAGADEATLPRAILPGSFNPLHDGHLSMHSTAARILKCPVEFEISVANVDKPDLSSTQVSRRLEQFAAEHVVWVTFAATFATKAQLFAPCTFVVGADTISRIAQQRYYSSSSDLEQTLAGFAERDVRFLVFGRKIRNRFESLFDLDLPPQLLQLCSAVPERQFRADISSTELRG